MGRLRSHFTFKEALYFIACVALLSGLISGGLWSYQQRGMVSPEQVTQAITDHHNPDCMRDQLTPALQKSGHLGSVDRSIVKVAQARCGQQLAANTQGTQDVGSP